MSFKQDLVLLLKPYYFVNIVLSVSYLAAKKIPIICNLVFPNDAPQCELDSRETEILFFLVIVVMLRTKKAGSVTMINYLTSSFMYNKAANLILWFYADIRLGIAYGILFILLGMLLPEPTYSGPENVVYFRTVSGLEEELHRDRKITWLVVFYTVWNPACTTFAPIFAQLSSQYVVDNFKFGKIDVGRYPEAAKKYNINDSSMSRQLPSVILFRDGKEVTRRPTADHRGKLIKFFFSEDNMKAAFDLNNLFNECKANPLKKKKTVANAATTTNPTVETVENSHLKSE